MAKTSTGRSPRVRAVTREHLESAGASLQAICGELAAVADRMRDARLKQVQLTGWGKYARALDLLRQFSAHAEFAVKTAPTRD